jgi:hypothetical protein
MQQTNMMNFLCIKWGDKYSTEYVNNLYKMVKKNYTKPFTFTCFTDESEGLICDTKGIPDDGVLHPQYWFGKENYCWDRAKFLIFNSHNWLPHEGKYCYFDLDVIIQSNINEIERLAEKPRILHSRWQPESQKHERFFIDIRGTFFNSSMMLWKGNQCENIYLDVIFNEEVVFKTFFKGSDNYHYWRQRDLWSNIPSDWAYSYNRGKHYPNDIEKFKYREDAKICIFNTDLTPDPAASQQKKINELEDQRLLDLWNGVET